MSCFINLAWGVAYLFRSFWLCNFLHSLLAWTITAFFFLPVFFCWYYAYVYTHTIWYKKKSWYICTFLLVCICLLKFVLKFCVYVITGMYICVHVHTHSHNLDMYIQVLLCNLVNSYMCVLKNIHMSTQPYVGIFLF